ncbi:MAG: imidazole glycerol phosphate synthase subunit HisH [Nitrospirae bacterium]|nr:imidazole glycerol phosphate synthase subunit HisH [Nitrospirota bacterium]
MIAIIDYGMGNLRSVQKAFEAVGHQAVVTRESHVIADASHVVLPGVGAFADCMANLQQYGLIEPIRKAIASGKPFLGICLGLQLLFTESEEFGLHKGLDIVPGRVKRFPPPRGPESAAASDTSGKPAACLKVPHMGWNALSVTRPAPPLRGIETGAYFYFVHSYYVEPQEPSVVCSVTEYGVPFASSIWRENIFACQFHPEKSQTVGLSIIRNFGQWQ